MPARQARQAKGLALPVIAGLLCVWSQVLDVFVFVPSSLSVQQNLRSRTARFAEEEKKIDWSKKEWMQPYKYDTMEKEAESGTSAFKRDVKVTDVRDLNELLKLPDPLAPTGDMLLMAVTLDDGTRIERPDVKFLQKLNPSSIRPVIFHWIDKSEFQTAAPKKYDGLIQRMLNGGPAEMEDIVRANWKAFDQGFFFRLTELKTDTNDERLKEKITNLENMAYELMEKAQEQYAKQFPEQKSDAEGILQAMIEEDGETLLWPPPAEAYGRLANEVELRATRNKYEDGWFENTIQFCEKFAKGMRDKGQEQLALVSQIAMQRVVTEWLRHDTLWEETDEGRFIYRLMSISHEQWREQLLLETSPLDATKIRDELKIISETKIMALPMGSKLQIYASKYIQGVVDFISKKDEILAGKPATA
eukprot:TRINITY_DN10699_c0_g1_i2.p1 TRINITY_DN10699_c0_g1~~TRINITY_DN10699_c0_g1_i2.p1  ORF type:complete len:418 (+),score=109.36 TRINITY_DN10699_c0_g1_i2:73-1326(+)